MGRKTRLVSDLRLAKNHSAGARITVLQVLAHQRLGARCQVPANRMPSTSR